MQTVDSNITMTVFGSRLNTTTPPPPTPHPPGHLPRTFFSLIRHFLLLISTIYQNIIYSNIFLQYIFDEGTSFEAKRYAKCL